MEYGEVLAKQTRNAAGTIGGAINNNINKRAVDAIEASTPAYKESISELYKAGINSGMSEKVFSIAFDKVTEEYTNTLTPYQRGIFNNSIKAAKADTEKQYREKQALDQQKAYNQFLDFITGAVDVIAGEETEATRRKIDEGIERLDKIEDDSGRTQSEDLKRTRQHEARGKYIFTQLDALAREDRSAFDKLYPRYKNHLTGTQQKTIAKTLRANKTADGGKNLTEIGLSVAYGDGGFNPDINNLSEKDKDRVSQATWDILKPTIKPTKMMA